MDLSMTEPHRHMTWIDTGLVIVTVAAGTVLATAAGNFWPTGRSSLMMVAAAVIVLFGVGVAWSLRAGFDLYHGRRWRWSLSALPVLILVAVGAALLTRPDFERTRPQFEQIAADLRASPERSYAHDLRLGRFDIDVAYDTSVGEVYFHNARRWPLSSSNPGWVYSPDRVPRGIERLNLERIGDGWYRFGNVTVD